LVGALVAERAEQRRIGVATELLHECLDVVAFECVLGVSYAEVEQPGEKEGALLRR
jgi:hypothetical protein